MKYTSGDLILMVRKSHRWYWLPRLKKGGIDGRYFGLWWLGLFVAPYPPLVTRHRRKRWSS